MKTGSSFKYLKVIIAILSAAVLTAAVFLVLYFNGAFLPSYASFNDKTYEDESVSISLSKGRIKILRSDSSGNMSKYYESPLKWKVQDFLYYDLDSDGENELLLLTWKVGKYGLYKPFFVDRDTLLWTEHIYIFELENQKIKQKWMASELNREVKEMELTDDGALLLRTPSGEETYWIWEGFGLKNIVP